MIKIFQWKLDLALGPTCPNRWSPYASMPLSLLPMTLTKSNNQVRVLIFYSVQPHLTQLTIFFSLKHFIRHYTLTLLLQLTTFLQFTGSEYYSALELSHWTISHFNTHSWSVVDIAHCGQL